MDVRWDCHIMRYNNDNGRSMITTSPSLCGLTISIQAHLAWIHLISLIKISKSKNEINYNEYRNIEQHLMLLQIKKRQQLNGGDFPTIDSIYSSKVSLYLL